MIRNVGLYVHIPFCEKRCKYCDFFSCTQTELIGAYVDELCKEIEGVGKRYPSEITTLYFGGGTPGLLTPLQLEKILDTIQKSFLFASAETTIELNEYKSLGIDRVSVGIQTLNDGLLKKIGRLHTAEVALNTLEKASSIFDSVNADLILGLGKEQDILSEIERIAPFVNHFSAYMLTVPKKSPIAKMIKEKTFSPLDSDACVDQYERLTAKCRDLGLFRYETSNYARLGKESKHNSKYWFMVPYIGVGPSAHSYIESMRYYNKSDLNDYLAGKHSGNCKEVNERVSSIEDDITETIMLALRTSKGLDIDAFDRKFNENFLKTYQKGINSVKNFVSVTDNRIYILPKYYSVQNHIIAKILFN